MTPLELHFLGTGDAFGDGARLQSCMLLETDGTRLLVDCGATSLVALKRAGIDPNEVDGVVVSHFHGDHFGGIPYLMLDGQFRGRARALAIAGPPGVERRVRAEMESAFPGSSSTSQRFAVSYRELGGVESDLGGFAISALPVTHTPGANALGIRIRAGDTVVAYSGDTEWTEALADLSRGADVFVCEAYSFDKPIPYHLSYRSLTEHRAAIRAKRVYLTHLGPEMLERRDEVRELIAEEGMIVRLP